MAAKNGRNSGETGGQQGVTSFSEVRNGDGQGDIHPSATKYDGTVIRIGDDVSYHSVGSGWRFGRVIGLHVDSIGLGASGLQMATVRFNARGDVFPVEDIALPLFRIDRCRQHGNDPGANQMAY